MSSLTWASRRYWTYVTSTDSKLMDHFQNYTGFYHYYYYSAYFSVFWFFSLLLLPTVWGTNSGGYANSKWQALLSVHGCSKNKRNETFRDNHIRTNPFAFFLSHKDISMLYGIWGKTASEEKCFIFPSLVDIWKDIILSDGQLFVQKFLCHKVNKKLVPLPVASVNWSEFEFVSYIAAGNLQKL